MGETVALIMNQNWPRDNQIADKKRDSLIGNGCGNVPKKSHKNELLIQREL